MIRDFSVRLFSLIVLVQENVWQKQLNDDCDSVTRWLEFVQHLATYSIEIAQIGSQSCIQILPNSKQTHWKWPNTVRISPKWPNFCKSGHTGSRWSDLTTHSGFTVTLIGSICIGRVIDELASLSLSLSHSQWQMGRKMILDVQKGVIG